ncbi:MAG: MATE family efflux transporter [Butyrivibrio sp.]|nr:MATE family efflux transporter [Butyrivibrio sp.]
MQENVTENPLGTKKISTLVREFSIPSVVSMLVSSLYNVVDQIFIGQGVGYYGNAATTVAFPLTTICLAIMLSIGIGSAAQFSLYLGRKEEDEAAKVVGNGFLMMVTFGTVYAVLAEIFLPQLLILFGATSEVYPYALSYTRIVLLGMPFLVVLNGLSNLARADGSPKYSMNTLVMGGIINTILDPIFILGFKWGVAGGAAATVIGQLASFVSAILYLKKFKRVKLERRHFKMTGQRIIRTLTMGMSNGITQISNTIVQIVLNQSLVHYGAATEYGSDIPLAINGIVAKVNSLLLAFFIGVQQGMQPIVGFNYGAKKFSRVKETYKLCAIIDFTLGTIGFFFFEVFPRQIISMFGNSDSELYMQFGVMFMRAWLFMSMVNGLQMLSSNFFAAIGKPIKGAILSLTRQVIFLMPLIIILGAVIGLQGVVISAPIADFMAFVVVMIFINNEMKSITVLESYN